jgi:anthranilate phosphoribosyltransferase
MIQNTIRKVTALQDLDPVQARDLMENIADGTVTDAQIGAILTALRIKGITAPELTAFAQVLEKRAVPVKTTDDDISVDTCGTGGDGGKTFNISTAAALVAAAAGVRIIKHGNRGVSSRSGSTDVLSSLNIPVAKTPEEASLSLSMNNVAFLFAPGFHPAMGKVAPARKEIGIFSVFNILGPLLNPAKAQARLIGVSDSKLLPVVTRALINLGVNHAMVVHGNGTDEITTTGVTTVSELYKGDIINYELTPEEFGISRADSRDLSGGDPDENAAIIKSVLLGDNGPCRDIVLINAAAALYLGQKVSCLYEGFLLAADTIDSGKTKELLENLTRIDKNDS